MAVKNKSVEPEETVAEDSHATVVAQAISSPETRSSGVSWTASSLFPW